MSVYALVVVPAAGDARRLAVDTLLPHGGVVGGRFTGRLDGYDPYRDRRNLLPCFECMGSGLRLDALAVAWRREHPDYTCGCGGDGLRPKAPEDFRPYGGDVVQVKDPVLFVARLADAQVPDAVLTHPDGLVEWRRRGDTVRMRTVLGSLLVARQVGGSRVVVADYDREVRDTMVTATVDYQVVGEERLRREVFVDPQIAWEHAQSLLGHVGNRVSQVQVTVSREG